MFNEVVTDTNVLFYLMAGIGGIGIFAKLMNQITLRRMVRASKNMSKSTHKLIKLIRSKYEHACMAHERVENVGAFVEKYIYEYRGILFRIHTWRQLEIQSIWFAGILAVYGAATQFVVNGLGERMYQYIGLGAAEMIFLYVISQISDEEYKRSAAKNYMVDYLQNTCAKKPRRNRQADREREHIDVIQPEAAMAFAGNGGKDSGSISYKKMDRVSEASVSEGAAEMKKAVSADSVAESTSRMAADMSMGRASERAGGMTADMSMGSVSENAGRTVGTMPVDRVSETSGRMRREAEGGSQGRTESYSEDILQERVIRLSGKMEEDREGRFQRDSLTTEAAEEYEGDAAFEEVYSLRGEPVRRIQEPANRRSRADRTIGAEGGDRAARTAIVSAEADGRKRRDGDLPINIEGEPERAGKGESGQAFKGESARQSTRKPVREKGQETEGLPILREEAIRQILEEFLA